MSFPSSHALQDSLEIQGQAATMGLDWHELAPVLDKIQEELDELRLAIREEPDCIQGELGDLFFSVVNAARWLRIDPETALKQTNDKFKKRCELVQKLAAEEGLPLPSSNLVELDRLWEKAKKLLADSNGTNESRNQS